MQEEKGLVLVYTGDGKGKTTAALGLAIRALGHHKKVAIIQFIKSPEIVYGERTFLEQLGVEMVQMGIGFTWTKDPEDQRKALKEAWAYAKKKIMSGQYDLIILDEINNALAVTGFPIEDVLPLVDVLETMKNRPQKLHLVLTGRNAKQEVIEAADLVTEMKHIKHHYEQGIASVEGIEY